jgi:hypothetical protein
MKVFLAGCENWHHTEAAILAGAKNLLFSYFHLKKKSETDYNRFFNMMKPDHELICDSGLFTLMFGIGKGGSYDMNFMREYTKAYIEYAKKFPHKNLTIVESDVHKLLGMEAVFELRKEFEQSGMKVLYVWHIEEGIDGLYKMAEKYDYIALSVPELRILCKGKVRYQDAVKDLERKIYKNVKRLPKIHLLGNTVMQTMETNISYSCDSTSWIAGVKYGRYVHWDGHRLRANVVSGEQYDRSRYILEQAYAENYKDMEKWRASSENRLKYQITLYLSARSYVLYQDWLDRKFQCLAGVEK